MADLQREIAIEREREPIEVRLAQVQRDALDLWDEWIWLIQGRTDEWSSEELKDWNRRRHEVAAEVEELVEQMRSIGEIGEVPW